MNAESGRRWLEETRRVATLAANNQASDDRGEPE
jgi:hypothetical protein